MHSGMTGGEFRVFCKAFRVTTFVLALSLASSIHAGASSLISHGGFEDPGFEDWTTIEATTGSLLFEGGSAHSGHSAAWFGAVGHYDDSIWQEFPTTPGTPYVLTFWLAHGAK